MAGNFPPLPKVVWNPVTMVGWQASKQYWLGAVVIDAALHVQKVTAPSTSAASGTTAPAFSDTGGSVTDGGLTWTDQGAGSTQTMLYQMQPTKKPATEVEAIRHDNLSSAGVRESLLERIDSFLSFDMEWVASGADLAGWQAFMNYALTGGAFRYYADQGSTSYLNMLLEDVKWTTAWKSPGWWGFSARFRTQVQWP